MPAGAVAALAAPVLMWTEFLAVGTATPGFNLLARAASDLGAVGAAHRRLFDAGFFLIPGALTMIAGVSLLRARGGGRVWAAGAVLVAADGVLLLLAGLFPETPGDPAATAMHQLFATWCFAVAGVAPTLLAVGERPRRLTRGWWVRAALAAALLVTEGAGILTRLFAVYPEGWFQRPFGLLLSAWYVAVAIWLLGAAGPALRRRPRAA